MRILLVLALSLAALSPASAQRFIVCIDPGHPSETSSGATANGLSENRLNWQVAVRLGRLLNKHGVSYVMTKRHENEYVTNQRRADIANYYNCAVFLRLHCDEGGGRGYTIYYPDRSGKKGRVTGPPREIQRQSRAVATLMNMAMQHRLKGFLKSNPVKTDAQTFVGGKQGGVLTGSIYARVPTMLVEMCFINRKDDARFIASARGQELMAAALASGVLKWRPSWLEWQRRLREARSKAAGRAGAR